MAEQKVAEEELAEEVDTANVRIDEINSEMGSILEQLGEAKVNPSLAEHNMPCLSKQCRSDQLASEEAN